MYTLESLTTAVNSLNVVEQGILFQLLTDNAELFGKILPDLPLLQYINDGLDDQNDIIKLYIYWKSNK